MLSIMLAALLNTAPSAAPGAPAVTRLPFDRAAALLAAHTDEEHLLKARKAMMEGALEVARREFIIAAALDRADGRMPLDATLGLAHVLFGQNREVEAARVLDELADEALKAGNADVAALALQDALWLHVRGGRRAQTMSDGLKLTQLLNSSGLSPDVRKQVRTRFR